MYRMNRRRMSKQQMMRMLIVTAVLIVIAVIVLFRNRVVADAPAQAPVYHMITVEKGDTLWDIAERFVPEGSGREISAYVENIRSMNKLRRDEPLQIGRSLLVVCYTDEIR